MTAPAVRAVGTVAAGTGTIVPGLPAGTTADDILLIYCESGAAFASPPTDYLHVADSPQNTAGTAATATILSVFWKRAGASESAPTVPDSGNHQMARMVAISGCVTTGDPWDVTSGSVDTAATTSVSIPGDTTTVDECLCLAASSQNQPATDTTTEFGAPTNGDLTSVTEQIDNTTSAGNGGGLQVVSGVKATAGTVGATTATSVTDPDRRAYHFIALKPPAGSAIVTPAVIAVTVSLPTPTILAASVVTPTVLAATSALPTVTVSIPATPTPAVVAATATFPAPTILAAATPTPAVVAVTVALPTPAVLAGVVVSPAAIAVTVTLPTPSVFAAAQATPAVLPVTVTLPTPTIDIGGAPATVTPAVLALTTTLPIPAVIAEAVTAPTVIAALVVLPGVTLLIAATVTPAVIPITVTLPLPVGSSGPRAVRNPVAFTLNPAGYDPITAGDTPPWN